MPRSPLRRAVAPPAALLLAALLAPGAQPPAQPPAKAKTLAEAVAADKYPLKHDAAAAKTVRDDRLKYYRAATVDVFDKSPAAKAEWAPKARAALELYARRLTQQELSGAADAVLDAEGDRAAVEAMAAKCDDRLVRYVAERARYRARPTDPDAAFRFCVAASDLYGSRYGEVLKLHAAHNWLAASRYVPADKPLRKDEPKWEGRFWASFEKLAGEDTPSADAAVLEFAELREAAAADRTRKERFEEVVGHLEKGKAGKALKLVAEATYLRRAAWDARGNGFANTITPEGRQVYAANVAAAREKLEAAWEADKTRPFAARALVNLSKDVGMDRAEMEEWFARALSVNPDDRLSCFWKLTYLQPKWRGTLEDYFTFGYVLATSENVEGQFPLVAVDMNFSSTPPTGPTYLRNVEKTKAHYSDPTVWLTMSTAFERVLGASPGNDYFRTAYARVACLAGRLDVAHAQFVKLGDRYEPRFFPEAGEYDRWVAEAKAAAAKPKK